MQLKTVQTAAAVQLVIQKEKIISTESIANATAAVTQTVTVIQNAAANHKHILPCLFKGPLADKF